MSASSGGPDGHWAPPAKTGTQLHLSARAVERDVSAVFGKLGPAPSDTHNRRVLAVLAFLGMQPRAAGADAAPAPG